jgi:hypothetical protein
MTFHIAAPTTTTATTTARTIERKPFVMAIGGAALALTVAAGLGVWQAQHHTSVQTAAPGAIAPVQRSVAGESALPLGGVAERITMQGTLTEGAVTEPEHPVNATAARLTGQHIAPAEAGVVGGVAERTTIQRQLDDDAQANVIGGVAERITMQGQRVTAP